MLILSRKIGEAIVIPELHTTLTILRVSGRNVRIGIQAPTDYAVYRHELWNKIQSESDGELIEPRQDSNSRESNWAT
jgi:carbon storage regulator